MCRTPTKTKRRQSNSMRDAQTLINRIANTGEIDPEAARWLADSLRGWWMDGSDPSRLPAFLHLACGSRSEIAERDKWLRLAGAELPEHNRAASLKKRVDAFMRRRWPEWRGGRVPPECDPIDSALFFAADSGASMRISRRQICNILNGK